MAATQGEKESLQPLEEAASHSQCFKDTLRLCRAEIRSSKAQIEMNRASAVNDNKKCFCKHVNSKRQTRESLHPLLDTGGNMATSDEEKADVLNACFASVFNYKTSCTEGIQPPQPEDRDWENDPPTIQEETVTDLLHHIDTHKSMALDGIHPRVLKELAGLLAKPLSSIYQQSWLTGEVPTDWKLASVTPIYKKGRKDDPGNYRPVSLTSVPAKLMEQLILRTIIQHVRDNQMIRPSQRGFMKGRSCLTNLISFYNRATCLLDEGKAVDVVYLNFSKAFDTISHSILLVKLADRGLDGHTLH